MVIQLKLHVYVNDSSKVYNQKPKCFKNQQHSLYHFSISVFFYNYGWVDYGVPTLESVLDMVKVVDFAVREGKVAVHCHAGLGRTGVLVACYLVYSRRIGGDEAITIVREKR